MLSKAHRLGRHGIALLRRSNPSTLRTKLFTSYYFQFPESVVKCAVITGKRVAKRAVDRNRLRRQFYAAIHVHFKDFPNGLHALFIVQPPARGATYQEIEKEIEMFIKKLKSQNSKVKTTG